MARTARWLTISSPASEPEPRTRLSTPERDARLRKEFDEADGRRGRICRRLEDDRVARDERGRELPDGDGDGEIPRRDEGDDAVRLPDGVGEVRGQFRRDGLAVHAARFAGAELHDVDGALQLAARLRERLALLAREQGGDLVLVLFDQACEARDDASARRRGRRAPAAEGFLGGLDRAARLLARESRTMPSTSLVFAGLMFCVVLGDEVLDPLTLDEISVGVHAVTFKFEFSVPAGGSVSTRAAGDGENITHAGHAPREKCGLANLRKPPL